MTSADFANNRDNYCYRHPDRQSFVLCQRCMRTICPECQTQAAVGVICPECLKAQQGSQTSAQRKAERRWSRSRPVVVRDSRPLATYAIIGITALVSVGQLLLSFPSREWLWFAGVYLLPTVDTFQPWRAFTALLVHGSFWHLALNMLALWMIGRSLEPLLGRTRFVTLYLLSGLGGSVAVLLLSDPRVPVVGASGAIFGLFAALMVIGRHIGANITGIAVVLGINLVIGFVPGLNVSWQAHVGGLVVGLVVGFIFTRTRAPGQKRWQIVLLTVVGLALLALLILPPVLAPTLIFR